jgi:hypothetical protein
LETGVTPREFGDGDGTFVPADMASMPSRI